MGGKFATSLSCMDGRVQIPLASWIKDNHQVDYIDTITEPGIEKLISGGGLASVESKIQISLTKHQSSLIAISGHHDCAGNPVSEQEHKQQILESVKVVSAAHPGIETIGLWVDGSWNVSRV